jgi:hypothetical protein
VVAQAPAPPPIDNDVDEHDDGGDGGEGNPVRWVTIATFSEPTSAHIARLRVESQDIPCIIADENMGTALWHYSIATGGIKLQVPQDRAAEAATALQTSSPLSDVEEDEERCARCQSTNIGQPRQLRRSVGLFLLVLLAASFHPLIGLITLFTGICFFMTTRRRRCEACGEWYRPTPRGFDVLPKSQD